MPPGTCPARRPLRVLVAEDHDGLRRRLAEAIDAQGDMTCVACVAAADQVVGTAVALGIDVVVLDLMLEGGNALHLIREVKAALPAAAIVVHSGYSGRLLAGEARRRGAAAYVEKGGAPDGLLLEIRSAGWSAPATAGGTRRPA